MELNLIELFKLMLRKWWIVLLSTLVFGSAALLYAQNMTPIYEANITLYVGKNADELGLDAKALEIGAEVILDYREIAKSRLVASTVIDELKLSNTLVSDLSKRINVEQKPGTRIISISVADPDPKMAQLITNKVADVFMQKVTDIMQVKNIQVIDSAEVPIEPVSLSSKLIVAIGLFVGFFLSVIIIFLSEYFNKTINTPDDIRKHLGLPVIGTIPAFKDSRKGM